MDGSLERTAVDLSGLMQVLGEALYSTPRVAVRELVQNAHDSCERRRLEDPEAPPARIRVEGDPATGTLHIEDNGAGLTDDEIRRYLATVGSGYTRTLRQRDPDAGLIGYFGLGFLSAFVVSERTEVWTCSYRAPHGALRFSSRNGESYTVVAAPARAVGTRVSLKLRESFLELADPAVLRALLSQYCPLLRFPVEISGDVVNAEPAPWRVESGPALRRRKQELAFAARFERRFEVLATIALDDAASGLKGLLWLHDGATFATSDHRSVSVFVRGMLIGEDERDLLPSWAGFAGAVLESNVLKPTASRETLQEDSAYQAAAHAVRERLITGLSEIAKHEPASWRRILLRHNEAMLGAALSDLRLFDLLAQDVTLPTSEGDLTVGEVLARAGGKLHVSQSDEGGFEELLFRALKVPIVRGTRYGALPFCRTYTERKSGTLVVLGTAGGDRTLFKPAPLPASEAAQLASWFGDPDRKVVSSRFLPKSLPFVLIPNREVLLKRRIETDEADRRIGAALLSLARIATARVEGDAAETLYVNLDCPAVSALFRANEARVGLALSLMRPLQALVTDANRRGDIEAALTAFNQALSTILEET